MFANYTFNNKKISVQNIDNSPNWAVKEKQVIFQLERDQRDNRHFTKENKLMENKQMWKY